VENPLFVWQDATIPGFAVAMSNFLDLVDETLDLPPPNISLPVLWRKAFVHEVLAFQDRPVLTFRSYAAHMLVRGGTWRMLPSAMLLSQPIVGR